MYVYDRKRRSLQTADRGEFSLREKNPSIRFLITYVQDPFPLRRGLPLFEGSTASTFAEFQHIATSFDVLSEIATQKFRREQLRTSLSKFGGP